MPRSMRPFGLGDVVAGKFLSSPYICRSCRHLALRQRFESQQPLRHASSKRNTLIEKIRSKIGFRDEATGLEDRYDGESFLARRRKERAEEKEAQELKKLEDENATQGLAPSGSKYSIGRGDAKGDDDLEEYVASETWDGLEHIGHKGHWADIPPTREDYFQAFFETGGLIPSKPEHFRAAIHQAIVEIITLQQAGKNLNLSTLAKNWYPEIQDLIARTEVEILPGDARLKLTYPTEETKGIIIGWFFKRLREEVQQKAETTTDDIEAVGDLSTTSEADVQEGDEGSDVLNEDEHLTTIADITAEDVYDAAEVEDSILPEDEKLAERQRCDFEVQHGRNQESRRIFRPTHYEEIVKMPASGMDQSYLDLKLNFKHELTYFLFRRITELTRLRIADPVLAKMTTLRSIYMYQLEALKPKPKNLAETLIMRTELATLPNVKIMGRRETPVDKEKAVGRWKVIEAELRSRGLPVLGRAEA